MSFEQIILLVTAAAAAIWGVLKVFIPRLVEARLAAQIDEREYMQSTGNIAIDILRDYVREINAERAREVDQLTNAINSNTEAVQQSGQAIQEMIQANTDAIRRQGLQVENNSKSIIALAGAIDQLREQIGK